MSVLPRAVRRADARHGEEHERVPEQQRVNLGANPRKHLEEPDSRRNGLVDDLSAGSLRGGDGIGAGLRRGVRGGFGGANSLRLVRQSLFQLDLFVAVAGGDFTTHGAPSADPERPSRRAEIHPADALEHQHHRQVREPEAHDERGLLAAFPHRPHSFEDRRRNGRRQHSLTLGAAAAAFRVILERRHLQRGKHVHQPPVVRALGVPAEPRENLEHVPFVHPARIPPGRVLPSSPSQVFDRR